MTDRTRATLSVHQFHSGTGFHDAITRQMLSIQKVLRELGYVSDIFAEHIDPELRDQIRRFELYEDTPDQVLLWHHSMGNYGFDRMLNLAGRVITVYHNITPPKYLSDPEVKRFSRLGTEQLEILAKRSSWGVAASNFNRKEMHKVGFDRVEVIPPKIEIGLHSMGAKTSCATKDWIFVGRIVGNKCQHDVVKAFVKYREMFSRDSRLYLVGPVVDTKYEALLYETINSFGVSDSVVVTGAVSDSELHQYYLKSSAFVSMSEHEGFCVPLVEAFEYDIPVFAYGAAAVPETLGGAGILLTTKDPTEIACTIHHVLSDELMVEATLQRQRQRLKRLAAFNIKDSLLKIIRGTQGIHQPLSIQVKGPFDSSYSLAVMNRQLGEHLSNFDTFDVSLFATEGSGDYDPDENALRDYPTAKRLFEHGKNVIYPEVEIRQMWPPRLSDATGSPTIQYFAWEETRVPSDLVREFNSYSDAMAVTSSFVKEALLDSGVTVPIHVVGNGVVVPSKEGVSLEIPELSELAKVSFLNISSGFPRKGLDVLLRAYFRAFDEFDDVTLIIKTFPNPHNEIDNLLAQLRLSNQHGPDVKIINRDLSDSVLQSLYYRVTCYVNPSRGEGFGLPVAEAMLAGTPVISVAHSGLADFVDETTASIIPHTMSQSRSHLHSSGSLWFEPDEDTLVRLLRLFYEDPDSQTWKEKSLKAKSTIATKYSWDIVGQRWSDLISDTKSSLRRLKVVLLSTWNSKCGIAEYSSYLTSNLSDYVEYNVIAETGVTILDSQKEIGIQRLWQNRWHGDLKATYEAIGDLSPDIVHIQFNFAFFELGQLSELLTALGESCKLVITLHSTMGRGIDGEYVTLRHIADALSKVDALVVHSRVDVDRLTSMGLESNVKLIPQGIADVKRVDRLEVREALSFQDKIVIGTFGFLLPHKGILELLDSFRTIKDQEERTHLLALSAIHPDEMSKRFETEVRQHILNLGLERDVSLITEFLPDDVTVNLLSACTVIVLPYRETLESSSASAHMAISAGVPVITSSISVFDPLAEYVFQYDPAVPGNLTDAILNVIYDEELRCDLIQKTQLALRRLNWRAVAGKHVELYREIVNRS